MINNGAVVTFEYTLLDETGNFIESNQGEAPVTYTHGEHQIIPGLEKGLSGMEVNEQKRIRVQPDEAYGQIDPAGFKEVAKTEIPVEGLKVGTRLRARGAKGEDFSLRVHEIKPETVILDVNHPLAGKTLNFDVKVLSIHPAEAH